jgi:hypothetical protein
MTVENDPAWKKWSEATDQLITCSDRYDRLRSLPNNDAVKTAAWKDVQAAILAVNIAANEIAPGYPPKDKPETRG